MIRITPSNEDDQKNNIKPIGGKMSSLLLLVQWGFNPYYNVRITF